MADFCKQCTEDILGRSGELNDLQGIVGKGAVCWTLCEGCGSNCIVDSEGKCCSRDCMKQHGTVGVNDLSWDF